MKTDRCVRPVDDGAQTRNHSPAAGRSKRQQLRLFLLKTRSFVLHTLCFRAAFLAVKLQPSHAQVSIHVANQVSVHHLLTDRHWWQTGDLCLRLHPHISVNQPKDDMLHKPTVSTQTVFRFSNHDFRGQHKFVQTRRGGRSTPIRIMWCTFKPFPGAGEWELQQDDGRSSSFKSKSPS